MTQTIIKTLLLFFCLTCAGSVQLCATDDFVLVCPCKGKIKPVAKISQIEEMANIAQCQKLLMALGKTNC